MKKNLTQYVRRGSGYIPIGETFQLLEAGYYDIIMENGALLFTHRSPTTDRLLRLSDTKSTQVIQEIERFWTLKDTFAKYGFVNKRGFLLYGPQGSGKSSTLAMVIARMIETGGVVINGASIHPVHLKKMLLDFREVESTRPLVVTLEDIENILKLDEAVMLALLDGDASIGNVVFLATTNYPEKLEARIINRPSRFDQVVRIGMPSRDARSQYLLHSDPNFEARTPEEFKKWLDLTDDFSIAQLKEVIVGVRCFGHTVDETVARIRANSLSISEKTIAKQAKNRTFFEKFYETCETKMSPEQLKQMKDATVGSVKNTEVTKANGATA